MPEGEADERERMQRRGEAMTSGGSLFCAGDDEVGLR